MSTSTRGRRSPTTPTIAESGPALLQKIELLTYANGVKRTRVIDCTGPEERIEPPKPGDEDLIERISVAFEQAIASAPDVDRCLMMLSLAALKESDAGLLNATRTMLKFQTGASDYQKVATLASIIDQLAQVKNQIVNQIIEQKDNERAAAAIIRH